MDNLISANVAQRPLRTAISVTGVALGVVLIVLFVGLARGMMRDTAERQANVDAEIRMFPSGGMSLSASTLVLPTRYTTAFLHGVHPTLEPVPPIPGVVAASPVGEWLQSGTGAIGFETIDGIDYKSFIQTTHVTMFQGRPIGDGSAPGSENEAMVDRYYASNNKGVDGAPVAVGSQIKVFDHLFTVVGIYEPSVLARIKIPLHTLQQRLGGADNCTFILIKVEKPEMTEAALAALNHSYPNNNFVRTEDLPALYARGISWIEIFLNVVIGLATVISILVILLAMYTTIIERTREIGILKSLGASKGFIVMSIEKEAALISLLGVAFGFVVSIICKYGIEASTRLRIDLQGRWLLIAAAIGLLGGILGALYPAIHAANLDPVEAISYE